MITRQQAQEAWETAQQRATATLTWPMEEPRPDPARDPQFPYYATAEREDMRRVDRDFGERARLYNERLALRDDFNPNVVAYETEDGTLPPLSYRSVPYGSGEGAIYSPEYLAGKAGNAQGADPDGWRSYT